jgi:alpha-tubulin suppressor-like RCC1 family protein
MTTETVEGTFAIVSDDGSVFNWGYIKDIKVDSIFNTLANTNNYHTNDISINKLYAFSTNQEVLFTNGARNVRRVVNNSYCSIVLYNDGTTMAYGSDTNGFVSNANNLRDISDITLSETTLVILKRDNTIYTYSSVSALLDSSGTSNVNSVIATGTHVYVLTASNIVRVWGAATSYPPSGIFTNPSNNLLDVSGLTDIIHIAANTHNVYLITSTNQVLAYGSNSNGQLAPHQAVDIRSITVGGSNAYGISTSNVLNVYGSNTSGQTAANNTTSVSKVVASGNAVCALMLDGSVRAWGDNTYGQTDISGLANVLDIFAGVNSFSATKNMTTITSSDEFSFIKSNLDMDYTNEKYEVWMDDQTKVNGTLYTVNMEGMTSDVSNNITIYDDQEQDIRYVFVDYDSDLWTKISNSTVDEEVIRFIVESKRTIDPIQLLLDSENSVLKEGYSTYKRNKTLKHLYSNSTVVSWGNSAFGGETDSTHDGIISIVGNQGAFAGLKEDGSVVCWGDRHYGGDLTDATYGLKYGQSVSSGVKMVYSTDRAFVALKTNGSVVCWGDSVYGGDISNTVYGLSAGETATNVSKVFSSSRAFALIKTDGSVVCWGDSAYGGSLTHGTYGVANGSVSADVVHVFSTCRAFAALKEDGSVVCWGNAAYGGNPTSGLYAIPSGTGSISSGVDNIYSNTASFAALKTDGSVVCWGNAMYGGKVSDATYGLKYGQTINDQVVAIYPSDSAYLALKDNGTVVCWGDAAHGGDISSATYGNSSPADVSNIMHVCSTERAFAVLDDGFKIHAWGDAAFGGNLDHPVFGLKGENDDIVNIVSTIAAFSGMKSDGSLVTWGNPVYGGDHTDSLFGIHTISGEVVQNVAENTGAFVYRNKDGSIFTWGNADAGHQEHNANRAFSIKKTTNSGQTVSNITTNYRMSSIYTSSLSSSTTTTATAGTSSYVIRLNGAGANSVVISDVFTVISVSDCSFVKLHFQTSTEGYGDEGRLYIGGTLRYTGSGLSNKIQVYPVDTIMDLSLNLWYIKNGNTDSNGDFIQLIIEPVVYGVDNVIDVVENDKAFAAITNAERGSLTLSNLPVFASMNNDEKIALWKNALYRQNITDSSFNITSDPSYNALLEDNREYTVLKPRSTAIDISGLLNFIVPTNHGELVRITDGVAERYFTSYGNGVYELGALPNLWTNQNGYYYFTSAGVNTTRVSMLEMNNNFYTLKSGSFIAEVIGQYPQLVAIFLTPQNGQVLIELTASNTLTTPIVAYRIFIYTSAADASNNANIFRFIDVSANALTPNTLTTSVSELTNGTAYWINAQPLLQGLSGEFDATLATKVVPSVESLEQLLNAATDASNGQVVYIQPSAVNLDADVSVPDDEPIEMTVVDGSIVGSTYTEVAKPNTPQLTITGITSTQRIVFTTLPGTIYTNSKTKGSEEALTIIKVFDTVLNDFIETGFDFTFTYTFPAGSTANRGYRVYHVDSSGVLDETPIGYFVPNADDTLDVRILVNPSYFISSYPTATIVLPFILDISAQNITVFGEEVTGISGDYYVEETTIRSLSAADFQALLTYRDWTAAGEGVDLCANLLAGETLVRDGINRLTHSTPLTMTQGDYAPPAPAPSSAHLADHFIQYIASNLFGHPQAQAPIKNDDNIMADICNNGGYDLGRQFVDAITQSTYMQSVFESLVAADVNGDRFDVHDTSANYYHPFPFITDDEFIFRVRMRGHIDIDQSLSVSGFGQPTQLQNVFGRIISDTDSTKFMNTSGDIYSRVWVVRIKLS